MATPHIRDATGEALRGRREKAFVAGHVGAILDGEKTVISRDPAESQTNFEDLLSRMGTDHVDAAMLFFVDKPEDYDRTFGPDGNYELVCRMKEQGKARFIGMSSHYAPTALKAVRSGRVDILMFPVNPVFDLVPPSVRIETLWEPQSYVKMAETRETAILTKRELYAECARQGVALIAMKPFASGWLFNPKNPSGIVLSPVQCLNYALSQPGVVAAVPGCKNVEELRGCLAWYDASGAEREYGALSANEMWRLQGRCMYCDHCLPCPVGIDVGAVMRCIDRARIEVTPGLRAEYRTLEKSAGDCVECCDCMKRCPFHVDVVAAMREGLTLLGG
jgi:predicted aldo/keto reductase-like oxidoreductase